MIKLRRCNFASLRDEASEVDAVVNVVVTSVVVVVVVVVRDKMENFTNKQQL